MKIIPKTNTLRKSILLYRRIRHRKGHGVHSPFVFNLITKVIEERYSYYSFRDIELLRKQLRFKEDKIRYPDHRHAGKYRTRTIGKLVENEAIKPKHGALLFRLTNYFKPTNILQIGPSLGLSGLYLSSYTTGLNFISLEQVREYAAIAQWVYEKGSRTPVDLHVGDYKNILPAALTGLKQLDFVYFNTVHDHKLNEWMFLQCLNYIHQDTVFVVQGIKTNQHMRELWKKIRTNEQVTVTLDLYSIGIVFFNRKLHKKNYTVYY